MGNYALLHSYEVDLYVEHTQIAEPILVKDNALLTYNKDGENENVVGDRMSGVRETKFDEGEVETGDGENV
ncbi:molybdopterin dehydrogenase [Sesbania bispinosa]|nr:molybdopterin dehydrogenase [Sesbania bispinosa]